MARSHRTRTFELEASLPSDASAPEVLGYARRPSTWPQWQSEIVDASGPEILSEGDVVDGAARLLGFNVTGRSTTVAVTEDLFVEDVIVGVRMKISYGVTPHGKGSIITHRMEADLPTGLAGSVLSILLARRLRKMQKNLLNALSEQSKRSGV